MYKSNVKVEQINFDGVVIDDYAEILSPTELKKILCNSFKNVTFKSNLAYGFYNGKKYCLYFKNISYLGNPHPRFKKRIQISNEFKNVFKENINKGIITLLIGIYKYGETVLFCDFDTTKYINNKLNNSSAHVFTIDLKKGFLNGIFQKKDYKNNVITVFDKEHVNKCLDFKLFGNGDVQLEIVDTFDEFFTSVGKMWYGIECYSEMIESNFKNKFQPEWPGFYLEYKLDQYINENHKSDIVRYMQNKKKGQIDLDLYFPKMGCYGDMKAHSSSSFGIQGNDYETISSLISSQSVYYVVCVHDTKKDFEHNFEVTKFWNHQLKKVDELSYGEKMKNSVTLTKYYILEINGDNKKYLKIFKQGKNSNGKPREPKISIEMKNINNFLIHSMNL